MSVDDDAAMAEYMRGMEARMEREAPVWTADSEDPAERMEREEREAYEALKAADDANPREAWEPFLSEHEVAVVERVLLVFCMALMHGETGEVQWAAMGAARAAELYAMLGGRAALIEWLSEIGPRLSLLQVRMASGESKGLFEPPF